MPECLKFQKKIPLWAITPHDPSQHTLDIYLYKPYGAILYQYVKVPTLGTFRILLDDTQFVWWLFPMRGWKTEKEKRAKGFRVQTRSGDWTNFSAEKSEWCIEGFIFQCIIDAVTITKVILWHIYICIALRFRPESCPLSFCWYPSSALSLEESSRNGWSAR